MRMLTTGKEPWRGSVQLLVCFLLGIIIWTKLLPLVGEMGTVKKWIDPLREQGINPSAMYYTDVFEEKRDKP
jgi:hypothetical protein